ncbi:Putative short-chain dehydrogenase/reductase SDR, NAD(P)-binding domain superfamily [Septoria linicola]|uniref:Short-chain dehydrogenase/reductase SDR, NAD(P)-binding domain superfamily n=1 Tax=Septoria linicola TaxID=215465 RepID=A0A9Q9AQK6_9PEZI|nr:putative short-chain dehydrogenase/reductase SDR, NAD(P)-binding domain superfamily [Septoria linicola]USW50256.1 Putative short-chain dehydrogenase/reductase SDR, NAD(P)-binding domain superfamily [Septoria linicola]
MAGLLSGKVAAITGGVTGIGRAIALGFLREGASVTVNFLDNKESHEAFKSLQAEASSDARLVGVTGDISQPKTGQSIIDQTVSVFGGLDVLVANAGVSQFKDFLSLEEAVLDSHLQTNIKGTFFTTQAAANQMVLQGRGGSIIGISSISAHLGGAQQVHYTPTKAAVLSMMQSQACALGRYNIRCNALLPGTTRTALAAGDLANADKLKYLETRTPLGRVADPEDIAGPAIFLASDLSKFVSGAQILVDGGISISLQ